MSDPIQEQLDEQLMWNQIRDEYMRGGISCKALARKYSPTAGAISARCAREGWRKINPRNVVQRVETAVKKQITAQVMSKSEAWVSETVERMSKYRVRIDESAEQMHPAIDPLALMQLARTEAVVDEVARRSLGLRDQPQELVVGTVELQSQMLAELQSLRQLQAEGKIIDCVPDVERMKRAKIVPD